MTTTYQDTAEAFIRMAHRIVWASVATVEPDGRPRTRILHPIWEWVGDELVGWIATVQDRAEGHGAGRAAGGVGELLVAVARHLRRRVHRGVADDAVTRHRTWHLFADAPNRSATTRGSSPAGTAPTSPAFCVLRLEPYRLRGLPRLGAARRGRRGAPVVALSSTRL